MRVRVRIVLPLSFLLLVVPPALSQDWDSVEIKATHIAGNIHMLTGSGGNIAASVGPDGILIVDDQFAPLADKIRAALKGIGAGDLRFVLNTHWHGDHTGSNVVFGKEATIIAHDNVRVRMSSLQKNIFGETEPAPEEAWPVITFAESMSVHFNGEEVKILHFPHGHTDGDSVIWFTESNVVHMGDDFWAGMFPFIDLDTGGNVQGLIDAAKSTLERLPADAKFVPGHGPLSGTEELQAYHDMLVSTTDLVRQGVEAGKSLEEIQAGFPDTWEDWATRFVPKDRWVGFIHRSLTGEKSP